MKLWTVHYPDDNGKDITETLSEDDILNKYWDYWYDKMCNKFGKDIVDSNYTKQDCIDDWIVINWAVESSDNG